MLNFLTKAIFIYTNDALDVFKTILTIEFVI